MTARPAVKASVGTGLVIPEERVEVHDMDVHSPSHHHPAVVLVR